MRLVEATSRRCIAARRISCAASLVTIERIPGNRLSTTSRFWVEPRSIAGVVQADCEELGVSLYPAGGFSSITLAYEAARNINQECDRGAKPATIFYVGDYDL